MLTTHIYNSIIWGNEQDDLSFWRNIAFEVDHSDIGSVDAGGGAIYLPGSGIVNADPLFVDPGYFDYHLTVGSPCIDAGIDRGIPLIDYEGEPRVSGAAVDMGADECIMVSVQESNIQLQTQFALFQKHPNPFNPVTEIHYQLPQSEGHATQHVSFRIYDILGQEVMALLNEEKGPGYHSVIWDGRNAKGKSVTSGVYFYRIETGDYVATKKMLLLK